MTQEKKEYRFTEKDKPTTKVHRLKPDDPFNDTELVWESETITMIMICVASQAKQQHEKGNHNSMAHQLFRGLRAYLKATDPDYLIGKEATFKYEHNHGN